MTTDTNAKARLNAVSKSLLNVHKSLLLFQKSVHEKIEGITLTAYDAWQLSVNHPEFEWLRLLSALIIRLDEATDNKELNPEETYKQYAAELNAIFTDPAQHVEFKKRMDAALSQDAELCLQLAELKRQIAQ